jgi:hypothetical protein
VSALCLQARYGKEADLMSLDQKKIAVGKCYATPANQHRKVTEIADGKVHYLARGGNVKSKWHPGSTKANPPTIEAFAAAVEKEIQ